VTANLLTRRTTHFTLWAPGQASPKLVIGTLKYGAPPSFEGSRTLDLTAVAEIDGLWERAATNCGLLDNTIYHYWFDVEDTRPESGPATRVRVTDPITSTPDWRLQEADGEQPASVVKFQGGKLIACDPDGTGVSPPAIDNPRGLATNNFMIIYELPSAWTRQARGGAERGVGTFRDIVAMLDRNAQAPNFDELEPHKKGGPTSRN
jgi:pullulanase